MKKLSVVVPIYNVGKYLKECLASISNQTIADFEVLLVDDGSTDDSLGIAKDFCRSDQRFRLLCEEHTNAGRCRNVGLLNATGEYILFLDSDDVFSRSMFESLVKIADKHQSDIVTCASVDFVDGHKVPKLDSTVKNAISYDVARDCLDIFTLWHGRAWDKLFRKSFIDREQIRFQEIRSTNDAKFTYVSLALAKNIVCTSSVFVAHRRHATSLEATRSKGVNCMFEMQDAFLEEMTRRGIFPENAQLYRFYCRWKISITMWYMETIDTEMAFLAVYTRLKGIIDNLGLQFIEAIGIGDALPLCIIIAQGTSPFGYLRMAKEIETKAIRDKYEKSRALMLGRAILYFPVLLFRFLRDILKL